MKKRLHRKRIFDFCIGLILVFLMLFSGLRILESTVFTNGKQSDGTIASKTVVVDGVEYFPRQDITVVMVLGIDQYGPVYDSGSYNNQGACDMVALLIFDDADRTVDVLYLNRDTMVEIPILGLGGREAGSFCGQLALAHTYGSGLEDSCVNVKNTLENFLPGLTVDYYVSMNMDAISLLNDAVGGVTVTVEDDFSMIDPTISMGQITLNGQQAVNFVRSRYGVGDQMNLTRIERQKQYISGFLEALRAAEDENGMFVVSTYDTVSPYLVTDCSVTTISGFVDRFSDYTLSRFVTPEGENRMGREYIEFYVDEDALAALTLELFYAPK